MTDQFDRGRARRAAWAFGLLLGALGATVGLGLGKDPAVAALDAALKQVTKATEGLQGIVANVEFAEVVNKQPYKNTAKLYVSFLGSMRAEIGGDNPRTVLFVPPNLYVYRPVHQEVVIQDMAANPDWLARCLMVGFAPAGTAMKKLYDVQLFPESTLDGKPAFEFLLTPKTKKNKEAAISIARIELWVDPDTGLPVQQRIVHAAGLVELTVRYLEITREDALPGALFEPKWPEGTVTLE